MKALVIQFVNVVLGKVQRNLVVFHEVKKENATEEEYSFYAFKKDQFVAKNGINEWRRIAVMALPKGTVADGLAGLFNEVDGIQNEWL